MPTSVALQFAPPPDPDIVELHIEEAAAPLGPWTEIETVVAVGTFPDYISEYTTNLALSSADWFRIRWKDNKGAFTPYSGSMQGGTELLIARVVQRVMQRDPSLVDAIVYQEAETVIASYFGVDDPYTLTGAVDYRTLNGLVYLTLAHALILRSVTESVASGSIDSATLGLVSFKSGTQSVTKTEADVSKLIDLANEMLGISTSYVAVLEEVTLASRSRSSYDHSRLLGHVGLQ